MNTKADVIKQTILFGRAELRQAEIYAGQCDCSIDDVIVSALADRLDRLHEDENENLDPSTYGSAPGRDEQALR